MEKNSFNKLIICLLISVYYLSMPQTSSSAQCCETMPCKSENVRYPFRVRGVQPESCGCQGFDLYCDNELGLLLELPNAGNFTVHMYYYSREIALSDPNECIAEKLLNLNLTTTPFRISSSTTTVDYPAFNCSKFDSHSYDFRRKIDCLSGSGYTVIIARSHKRMADPNCKLLGHLSVPSDSYYLSIRSRLYLTWDEHYCGSCADAPPTSSKIWNIIGTLTLVLVCTVPALCYIFRYVHFCRLTSRTPSNESTSNTNTDTTADMNTMRVPTASSGLDQVTIDSYPVLKLGDSGRLIKPDYDTCPICLSEYSPKDTLKLLPHCLHRFHADCIDIWLKSQPTCPVCRTSPSTDVVT